MNRDSKIKLLQKNLSIIRNLFGWTTEILGEKIGVTKQTIGNLENQKTEMTKTQYIALRFVFEMEAETKPKDDQKYLLAAIRILVDDADSLSEEEYEEIQNLMIMASSSRKAFGLAFKNIETSKNLKNFAKATTAGLTAGAVAATTAAMFPVMGIASVFSLLTLPVAFTTLLSKPNKTREFSWYEDFLEDSDDKTGGKQDIE